MRLPSSATQDEVCKGPTADDIIHADEGCDSFLFLVVLQVLRSIMSVNENPSVHGLIVQLPLDSVNPVNTELITNAVSPEKDVDGSVSAGSPSSSSWSC